MPVAFHKHSPLRVYRDLEQALKPYIIRAALPRVLRMLHTHSVHIAFSNRKGRALGYYIQPHENDGSRKASGFSGMHTISLQIDLNPYALLFVFLHEWAHLTTQLQYGDSVRAHGREWKENFKQIFAPFHSQDIFPADILDVIDDYFITTSRYFETELSEACHRYGANRKAFERTYFRLLKKGVTIPAPYMGTKAEEISVKQQEKREKEREREIRKELKRWSEEQAQKIREEAKEPKPLAVTGHAAVRDLPEGALFRMEGKDYRLLAHTGGFASASSLAEGSALRIHGLLCVEVLEEAGFPDCMPFHEYDGQPQSLGAVRRRGLPPGK